MATRLVYTEEELKAAGYVIENGCAKRIKKDTKPLVNKRRKFGFVTEKIGGKVYRFRSRWEFWYALYLQQLLITGKIGKWLYESKTFYFKGIKRGSVSYLPDFQVFELDGSYSWVEVKGYLDQRGATKLKRMAKYYPEEKILVIRENVIKKIQALKLEDNPRLR